MQYLTAGLLIIPQLSIMSTGKSAMPAIECLGIDRRGAPDTEWVVISMTEVVAALIWKKDTFMICQRPAHKARGLLWEFVGGKVEPGETKQQALIRECREELAVTLDVGDMFMEVTHEYPDLTVHLTLFHAAIREGVPQKLEHNDIQWITVGEIDRYAFCPADETILEKLRRDY